MPVPIQDLGLAVKRLQWRLHREANTRLVAEVGISLAQWDFLRHLHQHPDASLHALAELTFQTDQSIGTLATRMQHRGLIIRMDGPGRAIHHRMTKAGEAARAAGLPIYEAVLNESVGTLSSTEQSTLHRLLVKAASA